MGIECVVVARPAYDRFFNPDVHSTSTNIEELQNRRKFYESIFSEGELLWASTPSPDAFAYMNPQIAVYRIAAPVTPRIIHEFRRMER